MCSTTEESACNEGNPPWPCNSGQTSPEVQKQLYQWPKSNKTKSCMKNPWWHRGSQTERRQLHWWLCRRFMSHSES